MKLGRALKIEDLQSDGTPERSYGVKACKAADLRNKTSLNSGSETTMTERLIQSENSRTVHRNESFEDFLNNRIGEVIAKWLLRLEASEQDYSIANTRIVGPGRRLDYQSCGHGTANHKMEDCGTKSRSKDCKMDFQIVGYETGILKR